MKDYMQENRISMKPKILFILHLPPPVHGAAMMGQYIHDSRLINESFYCKYINLTTAKSLEDIGKLSMRKMKAFIRLLWTIRKTVKAFQPNLVYVTPNACGGAFYKDFIVVEMLKSIGCKVVLHYHNKGVSKYQSRLLDNLLYRSFFSHVKVILLADTLYQDVCKYVQRKDVLICPNGIPKTEVDISSLEDRNEGTPHILFLSNLIESKGILVLLDACKLLQNRGLSFECDVVGGETEEISAQRLASEIESRGLSDIVYYQGRKYGEDKVVFLKRASIFVFPTYYANETFGLVLLEAMQYHLPCISTNEGGIPGIIEEGETGFIVEKRNPQALADRIVYCLDHPEQCKLMGDAGYKKYLQQFTLEKFEHRMKEILTRCLQVPK
jgi:glycosyltransferase involved in cell wall biosynthesis